jgi:hypothetical protein
MIRKRIFVILAILLLVAVVTLNIPALAADGIEISRYSTGAGGVSEGGGYSLQGSIGQAEAGSINGGEYRLNGGFWGGFIDQFLELFLPLINR